MERKRQEEWSQENSETAVGEHEGMDGLHIEIFRDLQKELIWEVEEGHGELYWEWWGEWEAGRV